jgi:hypothetical protein
VSTPELDDPVRRDADELAKVLASRQFADWRGLRFEPLNSPRARKAVAQLAVRMRDTFWCQTKRPRSAGTVPVADFTAKTDPPMHVANPSGAGHAARSSEDSARSLKQTKRDYEILRSSLQRESIDHDLARLVREYPKRLSELIWRIEQYDGRSSDLFHYMDDADSYLSKFPTLVARVRWRGKDAARGLDLAEQLDWIDDLIRQARDAISDFTVTYNGERVQRVAEFQTKNYRPNKRFREDQQELRSLARAAEVLLRELRKAMDPLFEWLEGADPDTAQVSPTDI